MQAIDIAKQSALEFRISREINLSRAAFEKQAPPFKGRSDNYEPAYGGKVKKR